MSPAHIIPQNISHTLFITSVCMQLTSNKLPTGPKLTSSYTSSLKEWQKAPDANFSLLYIMHVIIICKFQCEKASGTMSSTVLGKREEVYFFSFLIKKSNECQQWESEKQQEHIKYFSVLCQIIRTTGSWRIIKLSEIVY